MEAILIGACLAILVADKDLKLALALLSLGRGRVNTRRAVSVNIRPINCGGGGAHLAENAGSQVRAIELKE